MFLSWYVVIFIFIQLRIFFSGLKPCGVLAPSQGLNQLPPCSVVVEAQSLNQQTAGKSPISNFKRKQNGSGQAVHQGQNQERKKIRFSELSI